MTRQMTLTQAVFPTDSLAAKLALVLAGSLLVALGARVEVPMLPVPMSLQTLAISVIGLTYGARLAGVTLLAYLAQGAIGLPVFAGGGAGFAYMMGPTGGYLVGFAVAAITMGWLAERGWDKSVASMAGALLIGNAIIYAFGLPWMAYLFLADKGAAWVAQWGMTNFLLGDALKLALAALLIPAVWKAVGDARR